MMPFVKRYILSLFQLIGLLGMGICPLWFSSWYPDANAALASEIAANQQVKGNPHATKPDFWDVALKHISDRKSPVPYTAIFLLLTLSSGYSNFSNKRRIQKLTNKISSVNIILSDSEGSLRKEKTEHFETKTSYYKAIDYLLVHLLTYKVKFDEACRITAYRHVQDEHKFKLIFRYSPQSKYQACGRIRIPDNEGIVSVAWLNEGVASVDELPTFGTAGYSKSLKAALCKEGVSISDETLNGLTMPSRCYFAIAIQGFDRNKIAVVVFESTIPNKFNNKEEIQHFFQKEHSQIAKYIIIKAALDKEFNPDGSEQDG